jgi:hypothetical protein
MGSDPQSHLEAQNFMVIGIRKVRPIDWELAISTIHAVEVELNKAIASGGRDRDQALYEVVLKLDRLRSAMKNGTGL